MSPWRMKELVVFWHCRLCFLAATKFRFSSNFVLFMVWSAKTREPGWLASLNCAGCTPPSPYEASDDEKNGRKTATTTQPRAINLAAVCLLWVRMLCCTVFLHLNLEWSAYNWSPATFCDQDGASDISRDCVIRRCARASVQMESDLVSLQ